MMVKKKKKQNRSQSSTEKKTLEPKPLSIFHSKLTNGNDSNHMLRGMSTKPAQVLSSQSKVVRCPKCHKFLQEPVDVTIYKCSGCNSILQAKHWELEKNDNSIHPEDLFSSQTRSLTPVRSSYRKYSSRASPSVETAYRRHETSSIHREWVKRRADEFSVTGDFASARSCSSVVKLSTTKKEDTTLSELLRFVDSDTSFAEETDEIHHQEGSGDRICISTDVVNLETFEDKGIKERDIEQQQQQQPASRIHLEQSAEGGGGSKTPVRSSYLKYSSRASPLFERGHETSYIHREWMRSASLSPSSYGYTSPFHGSQVSPSEQSYHHHHHQPNQCKQQGREGWFQDFSSAGASPVRFQGETSDQKCYHWSSQQSQMHESQLSITKKQETLLDVFRSVDSSTSFAEETVVIHQDSASDSHLSSSDNSSGDRVCISTDAVMWETFEDHGIKEDIRAISSKFIDLTFQPQWNHKLRAQASLGSGEILVSHSVEPLNKKEHVYQTKVLSENTRDTQVFDLGELKWEDIMGKKPVLEKSQYIGDSICDSSSISSKLYDLKLEAFQTWMNHKEDTNQSLIGTPDQSGKATVREYMIHEEQSKHECKNISERQELLDKTISDILRYGLEEANEALDPGKVSEDGCVVSLKNTSETFITSSEGETSEERSVFQHMESQNEKFNSYYEGLETVYASERTWEDRVGFNLEEYETNYEYTNPFEWNSESTPMFCLHEPELLEPDNEVDGSSESSSTGCSFSSHDSSKLRAVFHQEEEPHVMSDSRTEVISVNLEEIFEWTSERAPTFHLYEPELGSLLEPDEEGYGRSESSSSGFFNDHVLFGKEP